MLLFQVSQRLVPRGKLCRDALYRGQLIADVGLLLLPLRRVGSAQLALAEQSRGAALAQVSEAQGRLSQSAPVDAQIAIGPEGGYASDELEAFRVAGFSQGGLGPRVLRTETAAIAALVWLQTRFGDM